MKLPSCGCAQKPGVHTCPICMLFAFKYSPLFEDDHQYDLFKRRESVSVSALTEVREIDLPERVTQFEPIDDGLPF